jgi:hypothetical protein
MITVNNAEAVAFPRMVGLLTAPGGYTVQNEMSVHFDGVVK